MAEEEEGDQNSDEAILENLKQKLERIKVKTSKDLQQKKIA